MYSNVCAARHQSAGKGLPSVFPAITGSTIAIGPLDAHKAAVLNGKPRIAMQAFGEQLGDVDLAAVITYQRNAFGNNTGDTVPPASVTAAC